MSFVTDPLIRVQAREWLALVMNRVVRKCMKKLVMKWSLNMYEKFERIFSIQPISTVLMTFIE